MPLQNRVTPFGELVAVRPRGLMMGNRGGRIHADEQTLTTRRWTSRQWICCVLDFKGRQREVWGRFYTELFFLDEVTALAAGHRPCFECRRRDAERFAALYSGVDPSSGRPRDPAFARFASFGGFESAEARSAKAESGDPALDSRLRGNERSVGLSLRVSAKTLDDVLHAERLAGKAKRLHRRSIDGLPDAAMIARGGKTFAVRGKWLLTWTPSGYRGELRRPCGGEVDVLTPPSILRALSRGYAPVWHPSAE